MSVSICCNSFISRFQSIILLYLLFYIFSNCSVFLLLFIPFTWINRLFLFYITSIRLLAVHSFIGLFEVALVITTCMHLVTTSQKCKKQNTLILLYSLLTYVQCSYFISLDILSSKDLIIVVALYHECFLEATLIQIYVHILSSSFHSSWRESHSTINCLTITKIEISNIFFSLSNVEFFLWKTRILLSGLSCSKQKPNQNTLDKKRI